ncbi:unnamed protein product [Symbiodinium sp. KB8]|nr:unnamed protein product [Symbiodinium sp. KB8]
MASQGPDRIAPWCYVHVQRCRRRAALQGEHPEEGERMGCEHRCAEGSRIPPKGG